MILRWKDFKYPTKEEVDAIKDKQYDIPTFDFKITHWYNLPFSNEFPVEQSNRIYNLPYWNLCLRNKIGELSMTYDYMQVYNNRIKTESNNANTSKLLVNKFLLEYFVEIFYYFYFSSLDILAQIIAYYYNPSVNEKDVSFNFSFVTKHTLCNNILKETFNKLGPARDCRNSFTHRFSPLLNTGRSSIMEKSSDRTILGFTFKQKYDYNFILNNAQEAMLLLSQMMKKLTEYVRKDTENNTYLFD